MSVPLSEHESSFLATAVKFFQDQIQSTGKIPTRENLRSYLHCREHAAGQIRNHIIDNKLVDLPPDDAGKESDEVSKDKRTITLPKTRIHTLEELIAAFEIDLSVWEVERFIANKWEMGFKDDYNKADVIPLFQVKAFLRRKYTKDEANQFAEENARLTRQIEKLRLDVGVKAAYAKRLARNHAGHDDLLADIKQFVAALGDITLPTEQIIPANPERVPAVKPGHNEDAVLLISDTHFGDVIRREDTSGFPEFDLTIAGNRFGYVIKKAKQCLALHRAMYPIKRLYVWLGGDIGNGVLHDSPNSNCLFPPAQVHFSYNMLKFALDDLLTLTEADPKTGVRVIEEIVLLCTVGNHMRLDEKMPHKYQAQRTLDWLIYQFVIERFSGHPRVKVRAEMSPYIFETIRGHRHLFAHGMQVGYRNSPDVQCKSMSQFIDKVRGLFDSPEWRRANGLQGETFARVCIGDIHVPVDFPRLLSNGSLNGQNELGVNWTLEPIPAGQQLFGVSDNHIQTWRYFLNCSHVQRKQDDFNTYGMFAAEYMKRIGRG